VVIETRRFEVPNAFRHLSHLLVRYASWDLTQVHLVDEAHRRGPVPAVSQDKTPQRSVCAGQLDLLPPRATVSEAVAVKPVTGIAPLLAS